MTIEENPLIRVAPYSQGTSTEARVVIRRRDRPRYLCLNREEFAALEELRFHPVQISEWLSHHMSGAGNLNFRSAISLLLHLIKEEFILDTTASIIPKLEQVNQGGEPHSGRKPPILKKLSTWTDIPLLTMRNISVNHGLRLAGQFLASWIGAGLLLTIALMGCWRLRALSSEQVFALITFENPELWLVPLLLGLSAAACWNGLLQLILFAGTSCEFIHMDLRLTAGLILNLRCDDHDIIMSQKSVRIPYFLSSLLLPLVVSLLFLQKYRQSEIMALFGLAFFVLSVLQACPLFRNPLVKLAECETATLDFPNYLKNYFAKSFFKNIFMTQKTTKETIDIHTSNWIVGVSCVTLVWLYAVGFFFSNILLDHIPTLFSHISSHNDNPIRALSSGVLLIILGSAAFLPIQKLLRIPFDNLAEAATIPLRKVRGGLRAFVDHSVQMTELIENFLREIPILAHLSDQEISSLIPALKLRTFSQGQLIIQQGEAGDEFYLLSAGDAQIFLSNGIEAEKVLDILHPGDSFGEIALLEKTVRTASVRALSSNTQVLVLKREIFDRMFPSDSKVREELSRNMRLIKLTLESQALSHLSPRQIREFVRLAKPLRFSTDELILREHDEGDFAYLIESGEVTVKRASEGHEISRLGRGDLVGATALLRNTKRTATVSARSDVTCLAIDKASFLKLCMANVFVALLVSDLIEKQTLPAAKEEKN